MSLSIQLFTKEQTLKHNFIEDFIHVAEIQGPCHKKFTDHNRQKYLIICLIDKGELNILAKGEHCCIKSGEIMILSSWTDINEIICSSDFHCFVLSVGIEILADISRMNRHLRPNLRRKGEGPVGRHQLTEEEMNILINDSKMIIGALGNTRHLFLKELAYSLFTAFVTDIANIIWQKMSEEDDISNDDISRADELFMHFMRLLEENIEKETSVEFYADKLCISKQYLSLIVKKQTGISVGNIISRQRYERAAKMLRNPQYNVQQVALALSFADQSAFGKFFKKHSKVSPTAYRKNIITSLMKQVSNP